MPVLPNAKHERYAQLLAKGMAQNEAYTAVGYSFNEGNASRLKSNEKIAARVLELKGAAAEKAEITIADLSKRLMRLADKGEDLAEASGLSVARAATMDVAKLLGLVVEKVESKNTHEFSEEMAAWLDQR